MATVRGALALYDGMTQPLQSIHRALSIVLNTFQSMQQAAGRPIDTASIQQAREELARAAVAFNNIEANAQRAGQYQAEFNRQIRDGTAEANRLHNSFRGILATIGSVATVRMAASWVMENLRLADVQRRAERQLKTVLHNMGAQDVEIPLNANADLAANTQVSAQTEVVTDYATKIAQLDKRVLDNTLALDIAGAVNAYADLAAGFDKRVLDNTLALDTAKAAESYNNLAANVNKQVLSNNLTLDTAQATDCYNGLAANVDRQALNNTLTLDTTGAANSYNNFVAQTADRQINLSVQADLQTDTRQTVSAFEAIKAKAAAIQSQGMFGDEAMIAGAAELSTYFSDTEAIMSMMDTLSNYAAGMSLGQEVDSRQMTDYATNLGKIMGGTYTAMSQKGFAFSETQKAIIEGTATQAQIVQTLGAEYANASADMQAAAAINQVIAESWENMYAAMSNTPQGRIAQLKNSLGDVREVLGDRLYPAVLQFVAAFSSHLPQITGIMGGFANICAFVIIILSQLFNLAANVGGAIAANWDIVGPLVYGAAAAMLFYLGVTKGVELAHKGAELATKAYHAAVNFLSIGYGVLTGNTAAASAATFTFNSALMACPITWVVMGFIAIIAIIYTAVGAINHFTGSSISATGLICGAIAAAGAFIGNIFMAGLELILGVFATLYNTVAMFANFFGNVFNDPVSAVAHLFFDLVDNILSLLQTLASAIDMIFGSKLADSVQGWRDNLRGWVDDKFGAQVEIMGKFNTADFLSDYRLEYGGAFDFGYDFGKNLANKFKLPSLEDLFPEMPYDDLQDKLDSIYASAEDTAGNTAAMRDTLQMSDEDLKWMRDIAEREAVNRYTTAEIVVNMGGITNQVSKMDDLDDIFDYMLDGINQAAEISAEGIHI